MTRTLHAWLEGVYAGRFTRDSTGLVQFQYHTVTSTPSISLSLPREGKPSRRAAGNFLENLLPDHLHIRKQMADAYGIETTDTFDLLEVAGGDVAGGLLLSTHEVQPTADPLIPDPATDGDIAARATTPTGGDRYGVRIHWSTRFQYLHRKRRRSCQELLADDPP